LNQKIICFENIWITRREILKYLANIGSGAHSDIPETDIDKRIYRLRETCAYHFTGNAVPMRFSGVFGDPKWDINLADAGKRTDSGEIDAPYLSVDPTLVEVLTAARFVAESPDVNRLEALIRSETRPRRIERASFPH
jgi:hypothetical protein